MEKIVKYNSFLEQKIKFETDGETEKSLRESASSDLRKQVYIQVQEELQKLFPEIKKYK